MSATKREHHNALERERRNIINKHFKGLQQTVPELLAALQDGRKPSRAATVERTICYIQSMGVKFDAHQEDVNTLKRQNRLLEAQIRKLKRDNAKRDRTLRRLAGNPDAVANFKQESESDTSDSETSYTSCTSDSDTSS